MVSAGDIDEDCGVEDAVVEDAAVEADEEDVVDVLTVELEATVSLSETVMLK